MTRDECLRQVKDAVATNGAFALAVRFQALYGYKADDLMKDATGEPEAPAPTLPPLSEIELPTQAQLEEDMLPHNVSVALGGKPPSAEAVAMAKAFVHMQVQQRDWLLGLMGYDLT